MAQPVWMWMWVRVWVCVLVTACCVRAQRAGPPTFKFSDRQLSRIQRSFREWRDDARHPAARMTTAQRALLSGVGAGRVPGGPQRDRGLQQVGATAGAGVPLRQEYRQLSGPQRARFHAVLNRMKRTFPAAGGSSEYDVFVQVHRHAAAPAAHEGPGFLTWHREYLHRFEQAMRRHDPGVMLPYWDSTLDSGLPDPRDSSLWTPDLMGNNDGIVTSGPGAGWPVIESCHELGQFLRRNSTRDAAAARTFLYSEQDLAYITGRRSYRDLVAPFDPKLEFDHAGAHLFVEGHMASITCSPNDPIFWLHHTFVDYIWEDFRQNHQETAPELDYPAADSDDFEAAHGAHAPMTPFEPLRNIDGLSRNYTTLHYTYAPRREACTSPADCLSEYLWCDQVVAKCRATVRLGGNCTGLPSTACHGPTHCISGRCTVRTTTTRAPTSATTMTRTPSSTKRPARLYPGQYPFYRFHRNLQTTLVPAATTRLPYVRSSQWMPTTTAVPKPVYPATSSPRVYPSTTGLAYPPTTRGPYTWKTEGTTLPTTPRPTTTRPPPATWHPPTTTTTTTTKPHKPATWRPPTTTTTKPHKPATWRPPTTTITTTTKPHKPATWRPPTTTTAKPHKPATWRPPTTTITTTTKPHKPATWRPPTTTITTTTKPHKPHKPATWRPPTTTTTKPHKPATWRPPTTTITTTTKPHKPHKPATWRPPTSSKPTTRKAAPAGSRDWRYRFYPRYYPHNPDKLSTDKSTTTTSTTTTSTARPTKTTSRWRHPGGSWRARSPWGGRLGARSPPAWLLDWLRKSGASPSVFSSRFTKQE